MQYQDRIEFVIANAIPRENNFRRAKMGYKRAEEILPTEVIELIQQYVDGENVYIPRRSENRREWGTTTQIKQELMQRNKSIFDDYNNGYSVSELSEKYFLSVKSIQRILREMKK